MYHSLAPYYKEIFPLKEMALSFVRSFLKKTPARVLDVGCAVGQLAVTLARDGHDVAGIDLDAGLIKIARKDAAIHGIKINFEIMNMVEIAANFPAHSFDIVLCLGNTLVHLLSLEEIGEFIKKVSGLLKKDGVFIVQVVNYDQVLAKGISQLPVIDTEHVRFERHYIYDKGKHKIHFRTTLTVKKNMAKFEDEVMLYPLTQSEFDLLLKKAGFNNVGYFGDFSAREYTTGSPALIAVSEWPMAGNIPDYE